MEKICLWWLTIIGLSILKILRREICLIVRITLTQKRRLTTLRLFKKRSLVFLPWRIISLIMCMPYFCFIWMSWITAIEYIALFRPSLNFVLCSDCWVIRVLTLTIHLIRTNLRPDVIKNLKRPLLVEFWVHLNDIFLHIGPFFFINRVEHIICGWISFCKKRKFIVVQMDKAARKHL